MRVAKGFGDIPGKLKALVYHDDNASLFLWELMISTFCYALNRIPEIADNIYDIDNAMMWGYGWEIGVFESWDAIGLKVSVERMRDENLKV